MQWLDGFIVCDARVKYFENVVLGIWRKSQRIAKTLNT